MRLGLRQAAPLVIASQKLLGMLEYAKIILVPWLFEIAVPLV